jgi:hypothetical protein
VEFARFMERKFPLDSKSVLPEHEQLHKFVVTPDCGGKFQVHSTVPVNDIGKVDFQTCVAEFRSVKLRKPVQRASSLATGVRRVA